MLNRRQTVRYPIQLSALAHPQRGRSWLCTVRDFCEQGMLLIASAGQRLATSTSGFEPRSIISLHFSVATAEGIKHFRSRATVVRLAPDGLSLGVRFIEGPNGNLLPQPAYRALMDFAVAAGMAVPPTVEGGAGSADMDPAQRLAGDIPESFLRDRRINDRDATRIRARVRTVTQRAVERLASNFVKMGREELLIKARDAGTNAVQLMYFEGLEVVERHGARIQAQFTAAILGQVDKVPKIEDVLEKRRRRQTGNASKLELIDTQQFEEWLTVTEVISKTEQRFSEELLDLRALLGLLARPWSHKDVLPVGPATLMWAFDDCMSAFDLRRQVREDMCRIFERAMVPILTPLYSALGKVLSESGAFPSIEEMRRKLQSSAIRRTSSGVRIDPTAYQKMDSAVRAAAMAADGVGAGRVDFNPFQTPEQTAQRTFTTAKSLLGLRRNARQRLGGAVDELLARPDTRRVDLLETGEIVDALSQVEQEVGEAPLTERRLRARLIELLKHRHGGRKLLSPEDYDTLELMENLVDSISQDRFITDGIRDWIRRLELTLNKLAAKDPEFLKQETDRPHSAVQMLNQLARLGNSRDVQDGIDREVGLRVDELLRKVVKEYDQNPEVFEEVVDELHPLVDRQTQSWRGNVERTIRASEGQQKLSRARRAVLDEISRRLPAKRLPTLLMELLNPGWRNLLVHTHLRKGPESSEWRDQLAIIDQVYGQLVGSLKPEHAEFINPDELLRRIVDSLNSISFDPARRTPLVMKLSAALVGDTAGLKAPVKYDELPAGGMESVLSFEGLLPDLNPAADSDDESVRRDFERALVRARKIQIGEWLAASDVEGAR